MSFLVIETKTGLETGLHWDSWLFGVKWDSYPRCFFLHLGPVHVGWAKWNKGKTA